MSGRRISYTVPLKVRGTKGGYDRCRAFIHNSPSPSYLKRGNFARVQDPVPRSLFGILRSGDNPHYAGGTPYPLIPRYIRHIDKRNLAVIINPSYLVNFPSLPIDKIEQ